MSTADSTPGAGAAMTALDHAARRSAAAGSPRALLGLLLAQVLDGPVLTYASATYYARLADRVAAADPATVEAADAFASRVLAKYRSHREHALVSALVPFERSETARVRAALDRDCAICLKPLRGPRRLVRARAAGDADADADAPPPARCGHFFHAECFAEFDACLGAAPRACPLCRASLAPAFWEDHESDAPRF